MKENRWLVKPVKKMVGKKRRDIIVTCKHAM
jgi:hypothetical protein